MPKISVIIPTHNRPELLKKAVASVEAQTYRDFELIVIDDVDSRGGGWARNQGIRKAKGEYLAFLDDDDEWMPDKLKIQMEQFEKTSQEVGFCFSVVTKIYDNHEENTYVPSGIVDCTLLGLEGFKFFLNVTLIIKKSVIDDVGIFDENFVSHQESDLIIRITRKYKGLGIDEPLVRVSMKSGYEKIGYDIEKRIAGRMMILEKHIEEFQKNPEILSRHHRDIVRFRNISPKPMKLIGIMHVKNAIRTVDECLEKLSGLVDEIIVVDNGSTDGTLEAYGKYSKIVKIAYTEGYHGGRDVRLLLEEAKKRNPDWILLIDSDEVFEEHFTRKIVEGYMKSEHDVIYFRMFNFWLSRKKFRVDRDWLLYTAQPQRQMFRNLPGIDYQNIKVHYGPIQGLFGSICTSPYRIKHFGYSFREEVERKIKMYNEVDDGVDNKKKDYSTLDPNMQNIVYLNFYEFKNRILNRMYIEALHWISKIVTFVILQKRRYRKIYKSKSK